MRNQPGNQPQARPDDLATGDPPSLADPERSALAKLLQRLPLRSLGRWFVVGMVFLVFGTAVLYVFKDVLHVPLLVGTLLSSEITILIRFLINDAWVFGHRRPTWKRLWQFHVASFGGGVIWMTVANGLPRFGVHYLIASTIGSATSMTFSIMTNFFWIWRRGSHPAPVPDPVPVPAPVPETGTGTP